MFIVVAIVIFGIFIVLANTVFGSEGLTGDLQNLFEDAIDKSKVERLILTPKVFKQLLTYSGYYKDYTYNESTNELSVTAKSTPYYLTIRFPEGTVYKHLDAGYNYKVSGYITIDGVPVTDDQWVSKQAATYYRDGSFKIDNDTGYFESIQKRPTVNDYILHARINGKHDKLIPEGSIVTVKDLQIEKVEDELADVKK